MEAVLTRPFSKKVSSKQNKKNTFSKALQNEHCNFTSSKNLKKEAKKIDEGKKFATKEQMLCAINTLKSTLSASNSALFDAINEAAIELFDEKPFTSEAQMMLYLKEARRCSK